MYKNGNIYFADGLLHIIDRTLPLYRSPTLQLYNILEVCWWAMRKRFHRTLCYVGWYLYQPNNHWHALSIMLLEHTSVLIAVFCNRNRSISNLNEPRLAEIRKASQFFESLKRTVEESPFQVVRHFLTRETAKDLQLSLVCFLWLCLLHLTSGNNINPGYNINPC